MDTEKITSIDVALFPCPLCSTDGRLPRVRPVHIRSIGPKVCARHMLYSTCLRRFLTIDEYDFIIHRLIEEIQPNAVQRMTSRHASLILLAATLQHVANAVKQTAKQNRECP